MTPAPPSVCFVAPNNYAVLSGRSDIAQIGGAEVQRMLIARDLLRRGWRVTFVTLDHGQPDGIEHDGVRVFKMCATSDGLPGLRLFHPRWTSLCAAMRRADADVYVQRTAGVETGQVALWCRIRKRRFVYSIANDPECDHRLGAKRAWRERRFFHYGLTHADAVIAQTHRQHHALQSHYGMDAPVIRSCAPDPGDPFTADAPHRRFAARRVLWVGRFAAQKRMDRLVPIAEALTDVHFDVVGHHARPSPDVARALDALRQCSNITLHGFVPYRDMARRYDAATLLLCTSDWEGFPNTFIEAWSRGIPVVTTFDPDGLTASHGLGQVADVDGLSTAVKDMLRVESDWTAAAQRCRDYYLAHHTPQQAGDAWHALLSSLPTESGA